MAACIEFSNKATSNKLKKKKKSKACNEIQLWFIEWLPFLNTAEIEPDINWTKDGKTFKSSRRDKRVKIDWNISSNTHFLQITDATVEDDAYYKVTISNETGSVSKEVRVKVEAKTIVLKPEFDSVPKPVEIMEGETIFMTFILKEG